MTTRINKSKLNFIIDVFMFLTLISIAGIGFMIKYVLVPGFKRNEIYGKDVELYFLGLDRHQWGSIHLILGFVLLFFLLLHITFHWNLIVCLFKCVICKKVWRIVTVIAFLMISFGFGVIPLFLQPNIQKSTTRHLNQNQQKTKQSEAAINKFVSGSSTEIDKDITAEKKNFGDDEQHNIEVFGYMTIDEVAEKYNIPAVELASCINVPVELTGEKLGRLRKRYGFRMDDLRNYIELKNKR